MAFTPFALALLVTGCASFGYKTIEKPHYWQVSHPEKDQTLYVLGTVHKFISIYEIPDWVLEDLETSELF